jgi:hypothetical protein
VAALLVWAVGRSDVLVIVFLLALAVSLAANIYQARLDRR